MSGVDFSLVAGEVQGGSAAWPRLNDEAGGDDLATMETKNEVLAGDVSTGEGERSSGKVQQRAVWTLMRSRRWPAATQCAHDRQRGHRYAGSHVAWHRLCGPRLFAMELDYVATVARINLSAGAREWSGSERSAVHVALVPRGLHGCPFGASDVRCT